MLTVSFYSYSGRLLTYWYILYVILWLRMPNLSRATKKMQRVVVERDDKLGTRRVRVKCLISWGSEIEREDMPVNNIVRMLGWIARYFLLSELYCIYSN